MDISIIEQPLLSHESSFEIEKELLFDLSQIITHSNDDQMKKMHDAMEIAKFQLNSHKEQLKSVKSVLINSNNEYQRLKLINSVLIKIKSLKDDGQLVGNNRNKIMEIINNLDNQSIDKLKKLEDKLSMYVPTIPRVIYG